MTDPELKPIPCPCGGNAEPYQCHPDPWWLVGCDNDSCPWLVGCDNDSCPWVWEPVEAPFDTREQAIASWNRRASGWVSVAERNPTKSGEHLAWNETLREVYPEMFVNEFDTEKGWDHETTHWRPLPAPPEETP